MLRGPHWTLNILMGSVGVRVAVLCSGSGAESLHAWAGSIGLKNILMRCSEPRAVRGPLTHYTDREP